MKRRATKIVGKSMLVTLLMMISATGVLAFKVKYAIIGSIETVNKTAKNVSVKTAEGTVETIKSAAPKN